MLLPDFKSIRDLQIPASSSRRLDIAARRG
jgi:hypothetical protein